MIETEDLMYPSKRASDEQESKVRYHEKEKEKKRKKGLDNKVVVVIFFVLFQISPVALV